MHFAIHQLTLEASQSKWILSNLASLAQQTSIKWTLRKTYNLGPEYSHNIKLKIVHFTKQTFYWRTISSNRRATRSIPYFKKKVNKICIISFIRNNHSHRSNQCHQGIIQEFNLGIGSHVSITLWCEFFLCLCLFF